MIYTDAAGKPIEKPLRSDFDSDIDYMHAFYAWKDTIAKTANESFDRAFRSALKAGRLERA